MKTRIAITLICSAIVAAAAKFGDNWGLSEIISRGQLFVLVAAWAIAMMGWIGIWRDIGTWWRNKRTKMKGPSGFAGLLTVLLSAAIVVAPMQTAEARPGDGDIDGDLIAQGVCAMIVGGVAIYVVWKICSRLPPLPPANVTPPPPTNYPPAVINPTNRPGKIKMQTTALTGTNGFAARDISAFHMPDPIGGGEFHTYFFTRVETSENLSAWRESLTITGYVSDAGSYVGCWSNGACVYNAYLTPGNNNIPVDIATGEERSKFFRSVIP